jgi:hypothetical protein
MPKFLVLSVLILLMPAHSFAQRAPDPMQCQQIRQAVAQYGFAAARRYALENYGREAVRTGDQCFARGHRTRR